MLNGGSLGPYWSFFFQTSLTLIIQTEQETPIEFISSHSITWHCNHAPVSVSVWPCQESSSRWTPFGCLGYAHYQNLTSDFRKDFGCSDLNFSYGGQLAVAMPEHCDAFTTFPTLWSSFSVWAESIPESSEGIWWNPAETPDASDMRGESRFLLCDSSCSIECTSDSDKGLSKGVARRVPKEVFSRSLQVIKCKEILKWIQML